MAKYVLHIPEGHYPPSEEELAHLYARFREAMANKDRDDLIVAPPGTRLELLGATEMEWQLVADGMWIFGPKVRGLVRMIHAKVCKAKDHEGETYWTWHVLSLGRGAWAPTMMKAVEEAEKLLLTSTEQAEVDSLTVAVAPKPSVE